ncbi:hypothetical protein IKA92_05385 [bacterium]|nr:hypothetical protein [bacterium]
MAFDFMTTLGAFGKDVKFDVMGTGDIEEIKKYNRVIIDELAAVINAQDDALDVDKDKIHSTMRRIQKLLNQEASKLMDIKDSSKNLASTKINTEGLTSKKEETNKTTNNEELLEQIKNTIKSSSGNMLKALLGFSKYSEANKASGLSSLKSQESSLSSGASEINDVKDTLMNNLFSEALMDLVQEELNAGTDMNSLFNLMNFPMGLLGGTTSLSGNSSWNTSGKLSSRNN